MGTTVESQSEVKTAETRAESSTETSSSTSDKTRSVERKVLDPVTKQVVSVTLAEESLSSEEKQELSKSAVENLLSVETLQAIAKDTLVTLPNGTELVVTETEGQKDVKTLAQFAAEANLTNSSNVTATKALLQQETDIEVDADGNLVEVVKEQSQIDTKSEGQTFNASEAVQQQVKDADTIAVKSVDVEVVPEDDADAEVGAAAAIGNLFEEMAGLDDFEGFPDFEFGSVFSSAS